MTGKSIIPSRHSLITSHAESVLPIRHQSRTDVPMSTAPEDQDSEAATIYIDTREAGIVTTRPEAMILGIDVWQTTVIRLSSGYVWTISGNISSENIQARMSTP